MIHQDCVARVLALGNNESVRSGFVDMFNAISSEAEMKGLPSSTLVLAFYDKECSLLSGDWAAELHLVVRKVDEIEDEKTEGDKHPCSK